MQCVFLFFLCAATVLIFQQFDVEIWSIREEDKEEGMTTLDERELMLLCYNVGSSKACDQLATWKKVEDVRKLGSQDSGQKVGHCLPQGRLVFQHVMKTGGLSVDKWFRLTCDEHSDSLCSIYRRDGPEGRIQHPWNHHKTCAPSICTTHPSNVVRPCPRFEHAATFTVIRHPVARVWSFYNYMSRWYKPYQQNALKDIFLNYETQDLNHGLTEKERCGHCHNQLSNAMVKNHFAGPHGTLEEAKHMLEGMILVIELHNLGEIPALLARYAIFPESKSISGNTTYTIPHENPSEYRWGRHPDSETEALIKQYNQMDMKLYRYATKLPNYIA